MYTRIEKGGKYIIKGAGDYVEKKSETPEIPNADNVYQPFPQRKKAPISGFLVGGGVGVSGAIGAGAVGAYNQWSAFQYGVMYLLDAIVVIVICSLPYWLEFYKIHKKYKNDTPTENEKKRKHEKEMKEMEYNFQLRMKELEASQNNISDLHLMNEEMYHDDPTDMSS